MNYELRIVFNHYKKEMFIFEKVVREKSHEILRFAQNDN